MTNGAAARIVLANRDRVQTVIADFMRREGQVGSTPRRHWHFLPMPGTTVSIAAGPGSQAYLGDLQAYRPQDIGNDAEGFTHYRLHL